MVYVIGFIGFAVGFSLGQILLMMWLKDRPRRDLLTDKSLHYRYGVFNWILAALGCYVALQLYYIVLAMPS